MALTRSADLPDFENPPVSEVVLSLQFEALPAIRNVHMGLLWGMFRKEYPNVSEHNPLGPVFETFGAPSISPQLKIETLMSLPMLRFWFESDGDGSELIQVQQDRFIHNWRRRQGEYPRYEYLRERFSSEVSKFASFIEKEDLGDIKFNQIEATYINILELEDERAQNSILEEFTPLWTGKGNDPFSSPLEVQKVDMSHVLRNGDKPYGRIYVKFSPVIKTENDKLVISLEITARGKPEDNSVSAAFQLLDEHRKSVVKTFAAVTKDSMHRTWGRKT